MLNVSLVIMNVIHIVSLWQNIMQMMIYKRKQKLV